MRIAWYFDFISPFAYLQFERLSLLPEGTQIEYRPILFAGLLNHWAHKGPAEMPSKRRFSYRQALWIARRDGISFRAPPAHPFNPLDALRLAVALRCEGDAVRSIFRYIWAEGHRPDDPHSWNILVEHLNARDASDRAATQDVKSALRSNTDEAIALGVFGVPTIIAEKELFWGYDATDMAWLPVTRRQALKVAARKPLDHEVIHDVPPELDYYTYRWYVRTKYYIPPVWNASVGRPLVPLRPHARCSFRRARSSAITATLRSR